MFDLARDIKSKGDKPLTEKDPHERVFFLLSKITQEFLADSSLHLSDADLVAKNGNEISEEVPHKVEG